MPFYCPSCASNKHTLELGELKSAMAALVLEVEELKSSVLRYVEFDCTAG